MSVFKGSATAIITPFNKEGIDYPAFKTLIEKQIEGKADGIVVCGTTGEASTMSAEEKRCAIQFAVKETAGRVPVIAGTGGNNTRNVIHDSRQAEELGADALLVVTPYYNKATQAGLVAHYTAVAEAVRIPIIVYNVPARTGLNILPATMKEITGKNKNVAAIKEASGNIEQIVNLAALCPNLSIYSGNDDHVLPLLSLGGKGVISTIGNVIPLDMHNLCEAYFNGDHETARALQFKILPIWKAAFCEVNPIPIKTMCGLLGLCEPLLRLPLCPPSPASRGLIEQTLKDYGLL
ncbi:MAG: 4-hydroxy-tetrahydrodipicolinate synthase [Clostridiales bacterium]|jgi:4-hydroxy-tetrahydrodipicolinate synthase|nr:4-hydroxy-tetrahydrodipicolinate synthase [Clostridiales bacterium]